MTTSILNIKYPDTIALVPVFVFEKFHEQLLKSLTNRQLDTKNVEILDFTIIFQKDMVTCKCKIFYDICEPLLKFATTIAI